MNERSASGAVLILASVLASIGVALYTLGGVDSVRSPLLFVLTRTFIVAAAITSALGLAVLEGLLRDAGERVFSRLGLTGIVIGAGLIVVAEASVLDGTDSPETLVHVYVVLALLAQAAFGAALLRVHLLPTWVGRTTVAWNLGWLAFLVAVNVGGGPGDYYPVLHHVAPLLIGIELLRYRSAPLGASR